MHKKIQQTRKRNSTHIFVIITAHAPYENQWDLKNNNKSS